jgi:enamine deaminase RidA (YjgF/YER057c/UK114 family)
MGAEAKLKQSGITLPTQSTPVANYVPSVRVGNLLFLSGHGPIRDGKATARGKLGKELSVEDGYKVAREVGMNLLASARTALGSLDKVKRVVKVLGMVASAEGFTDQPKVINGFSDLMVEVFGEAGRHARSAVGMAELPFGIPVEIEMILEVE